MNESTNWGKILVRLAVAIILIGGAYVALAYWSGGRVPNGTTVGGVAIGGKTPEAARADVVAARNPDLQRKISVKAGDTTVDLVPAKAGFGYDYDRALNDLTGISYNPARVYEHLTGRGADHDLPVTLDEERLTTTVVDMAEEFDRKPVEGSVKFTDGKLVVVDSVAGRQLDPAATADEIRGAFPGGGPVTARFTPVDPKLSQEEIDRFLTDEAQLAISAPITIRAGERVATLRASQIAKLLEVRPAGPGKLGLAVKETELVRAVRGALPGIETQAQDASIEIEDGDAVVVPAETGHKLRTEDLTTKFREALFDPQRSVELTLDTIEPKVTTEQARSWKLDTAFVEFRSEFPTGAAYEARTKNIATALRSINGTLVMPDEQFALSKVLGDISAENGYVDAGVIKDGQLSEALGGGVSQVSTVVYNTAFFAGVQLDEHRAHSYYISRYPIGREATYWSGQIDNKWTNDTGAPILIKAGIEGNEAVMSFYGTRRYQVSESTGERTNIVKPERVTNDDPKCRPQSPAEGFDITVTRVLSRGGEEVRREVIKTHYTPANEVVCTAA